MKKLLVWIGVVALFLFAALVLFGAVSYSMFRTLGEPDQIYSFMFAASLVLGLGCLILAIFRKPLAILIILLISLALFIILRYGILQLL